MAVGALLALVERREDRRQAARDRQIALTDAIHWDLGAIAAPTVTRRFRGVWRVSVAVPLEKPAVVAAILGVTARHFAVERAAERLEIVLTPSASPGAVAASHPTAARPLASGQRLAA
ncbi:MAG TPA: hypothetical protein VEL75_18080 [Candidatus Methylomirabilis sp.]|nr:hypothetical protein [Candidatus Methylomirabilis sp.]